MQESALKKLARMKGKLWMYNSTNVTILDYDYDNEAVTINLNISSKPKLIVEWDKLRSTLKEFLRVE